MYQWWVFVHLVGVFGFLLSHGVSVMVTFRLRKERDPGRITHLLEVSGTSIKGFYWSLAVLLVGGVVAGFLGHWWGQGWIWAAIATLVIVSLAMYAMARPYYRRVGLVARAMAGGSQAVTDAQLDQILRGSRPNTVAAIGMVGLGFILYLMLFKPTFGFGSTTAATGPNQVKVVAKGIAFTTKTIAAPASQPFDLIFDNQDGGVPHNVAIYTDSSAATPLFVGTIVTGPRVTTYHVPALQPGTYFFRCDVHHQMTGTVTVAAVPAASPSG